MLARILKTAQGGDSQLLRQAAQEKLGTHFKRLSSQDGELGKVSVYVLEKLKLLQAATKAASGRKRPREESKPEGVARAAVARTSAPDAAAALAGFADLGGGFASTPAYAPAPAVPPTAAPVPAAAAPSREPAPRVSASAASQDSRQIKGILSKGSARRTGTSRITWGDGRGGKGAGQVESGAGLVAVVTFSPTDAPAQVMGHGAGDASVLHDLKSKDRQAVSFSQRRKEEGALGTAKLEKAKEVASTQAAVMPFAPPQHIQLAPREEGPVGSETTSEAARQASRIQGMFPHPAAEQNFSIDNPSLPRDPHMEKDQIWAGFKRHHKPRPMQFKEIPHQATLAALQVWLAPRPAAQVHAQVPASQPPPRMSAVGQANMAQLAMTQARKPSGLLGAQPLSHQRHGGSLLGPRH